jgi:imidazolonepropionase-like amidohydrolase
MSARIRLILALPALVGLTLSGCKPGEGSRMKAIIGSVLMDGSGGPPVTNSVVVTAGERIRAAGPASTIPIPAEADKIDGSGRFLVPAIVDLYDGTDKKVPGAVQLFQKDEAQFEKARDARVAVIGHIATLADAEWMVNNGATALVGMVRDTEALDPDFLAKMRNLKIVVAPALVQSGRDLAVAQRNTLRMFRAGVPIALATGGADPLREAELLSDAGIPPQDVITAITHNSSLALRSSETGILAPAARADLLLLSANPGEDIRNLRKVALRMTAGEIAQ